jgi:hypothetical protein
MKNYLLILCLTFFILCLITSCMRQKDDPCIVDCRESLVSNLLFFKMSKDMIDVIGKEKYCEKLCEHEDR